MEGISKAVKREYIGKFPSDILVFNYVVFKISTWNNYLLLKLKLPQTIKILMNLIYYR